MKSPRKRVIYDDLNLDVFNDVYEPAEDTFLIADILDEAVKDGDTVLEIGTGCGILAILAAKKARKVTATDANPHAVECARLNADANNASSKIDVRRGDLFQPVQAKETFDLIIFNAPYLPSAPKEHKTWVGRAWAGGPTGRRLIDQFIAEAPRHLKRGGQILLVQSSLADIDKTLKRFHAAKLEAKVIAEEKVSFENLVVIQASNLSR
ncbi:MAG TPA: HemK2/MTQ2 family protein methyltransferase [Candidatus Bathyarchaeia archaeon]|nr:HemK2/MTQ2 family protein methyltransferase [Candidatus Bathyarchaeia archaeon]